MALVSSLSINVYGVESVEAHVAASSTPELPRGFITLTDDVPATWSTVHFHGTPEQLADLAVKLYLAASELATACRSSEVAA